MRCQLSQQSSISEAMGDEPTVHDATFNIEDGLISVYPGRTSALDPDCALFAMDRLDDWATWEQTN